MALLSPSNVFCKQSENEMETSSGHPVKSRKDENFVYPISTPFKLIADPHMQ